MGKCNIFKIHLKVHRGGRQCYHTQKLALQFLLVVGQLILIEGIFLILDSDGLSFTFG